MLDVLGCGVYDWWFSLFVCGFTDWLAMVIYMLLGLFRVCLWTMLVCMRGSFRFADLLCRNLELRVGGFASGFCCIDFDW